MNPPEVIAELEINHAGSVDIAKQLIFTAKALGADTIKLQAFDPSEFTSPASPYRKIFESNTLSPSEFVQLYEYCKNIDINFLLTIADLSSCHLIDLLGLERVKIGSTNITNHWLLKTVSSKVKSLIISTGASTLDEIDSALEVIYSSGNCNVTLLHCTVNYPTHPENLNLLSIPFLRSKYPQCNVGFSDHSVGSNAAICATALGASCIEKHFTLSQYMDGPDHSFSINPDQFRQLIDSVHATSLSLGVLDKSPSLSEETIRSTARRFLTYNDNYKSGDLLSLDCLVSQRHAPTDLDSTTPLSPSLQNINLVTNKMLCCDVNQYQIIELSHFNLS